MNDTAVDHPSPAVTRRSVRAGTGWPTFATVIAAGFAVWAAVIGLDSLSDNSFFTHLATGRLLVDGQFPRSDVYSYTATGEPWVVQSWLASGAFGWADSWWGGDGVRVLVAVLTVSLTLLTWQLTRRASSLAGRVLIMTMVLAVGTWFWAPRPLLIGLVGMGCLLLAAEGRLWPPTMVVVMWVWANSHGSYPLGLVALAVFAWGRHLDGEDARTDLRVLLWAAGGCVAAVIGPLGLDLWTFPVRLLGRQEALQSIVEWQSPSFSEPWARFFLIQVVVAVVLVVRKPSYRVVLPLVVFTAAALLGARNIPVASLVLVPGLAAGLDGLGSLRGDESGPIARVGLAVVVVFGIMVGVGALREPAYDLSDYPIDALTYVGERGWLNDPEVRLLTDDSDGNLLELLGGGRSPVFIDDRLDMYPSEVLDDFLVLVRGEPGWSTVLDRREVDVVVWGRSAPLTQLLTVSEGWQISYSDDRWVVSCRRETVCR